MSHVRFEYNIEKDTWNVLRVINELPINDEDDLERPFGNLPKDFVIQAKKINNEAEKDTFVTNFLENKYKENKNDINEKIKLFSEKWTLINDIYFKNLKHILQIDIPEDLEYTGYLTSAGSCPFHVSKNWFMIQIAKSEADIVAAHEMLHIEFRKKYSLYCRDELKLTPKEFGDFEESSTFLLNEEMGNLFSRPDYGYKEHQKLRSLLKEEWKKHKDFKELLMYYITIKNTWKNEN